jgi:hypothetical protein
MVNLKPRPPYPREKTPVSTHYVGGWVGSRNGMDDFMRKISCLCRDSNPVVGDYTNYVQKTVEACFLPLCSCSSGEDRENHVNLSIVSVVNIPSGSDGYSSLETAVLPISYIGESVLHLFKDAVLDAEFG